MLDGGPLLAPCRYEVPASIRPVQVVEWLSRLDIPLLAEIYTVASPSVLYEMAVHCLQRPWNRRSAADGRLEALMQSFADTLRCFDYDALLLECQMLWKNHLEAGLHCVRFHPALERLLPCGAATQPADPDLLVP
eukprot:EG_transcript_43559